MQRLTEVCECEHLDRKGEELMYEFMSFGFTDLVDANLGHYSLEVKPYVLGPSSECTSADIGCSPSCLNHNSSRIKALLVE